MEVEDQNCGVVQAERVEVALMATLRWAVGVAHAYIGRQSLDLSCWLQCLESIAGMPHGGPNSIPPGHSVNAAVVAESDGSAAKDPRTRRASKRNTEYAL